MSAYKVGLSLATSELDIYDGPTVGLAAPQKQNTVTKALLVAFGLIAVVYVPPMMAKGMRLK